MLILFQLCSVLVLIRIYIFSTPIVIILFMYGMTFMHIHALLPKILKAKLLASVDHINSAL